MKGLWRGFSVHSGIVGGFEKTQFHGKYSQNAVEEQKVGKTIMLLEIECDLSKFFCA